VAKLCDYIYVMYRGEVVESGPTLSIFTEPRHDYTRQLLAGVRSLTSLDAPLAGFQPAVEA
jgi:ABC-type dipeptide/oligopeptide/nickel transport system ATPase component